MSAVKVLAVIAWILGLQISLTRADDLGASIIGCTELKCPADEDLNPLCRVANHTSIVIGLTNLNTSISENDLTWTKGVELFQETTSPPITYENNFYLGTPAGFDLSMNANKSNYDACALFFTVSDPVKFDGRNISTTTGTCSDVISTGCLNAILGQAINAVTAFSGSSVAAKFQALEADFNNNFNSNCSEYATDDKWDDLYVQALTGPTAPKIITGAQNSTSNCHPTLPKSNSLSLIASINTTSTALDTDIYNNLYRITPILTVFFPRSNGTAILKQLEAQLTCVKPVGDLDAPNATADNGESVKDQQSEAPIIGTPNMVLFGLMAAYLWGILG